MQRYNFIKINNKKMIPRHRRRLQTGAAAAAIMSFLLTLPLLSCGGGDNPRRDRRDFRDRGSAANRRTPNRHP